MTNGKDRSYVMIKPDGVQRSLVGEILNRVERTGLKISGIKMFVPDMARLDTHYGKTDEWYQEKGAMLVKNLEEAGRPVEKKAIEYGRGIILASLKYMNSGPVVAFIAEGNQAADVVKKIVGSTEPKTSDVGTIRGDLTTDSYGLANLSNRSVRNLVHCSENSEEAEKEIALWFKDEEIMEYTHINEKMLFDVNLDGIWE